MLYDHEVMNITEKESTGEGMTEVKIIRDGVILCGQNYEVSIAAYELNLIWRTILPTRKANIESFDAFTIQDYRISLQLLRDMRSRDRPTENDDSEA